MFCMTKTAMLLNKKTLINGLEHICAVLEKKIHSLSVNLLY